MAVETAKSNVSAESRSQADAARLLDRKRLLVLAAFIAVPLLAGIAWYRVSDNPMWTVFRAMPNWCSPTVAELTADSPDGRYRAHVAQTTCALRFTETMVFVTEANEGFSVRDISPDDAVLEIAGRRSLDAITWIGGEKTSSGRAQLQLWLTKGVNPRNLHRVADHWRDVEVKVGQSQPVPGNVDY